MTTDRVTVRFIAFGLIFIAATVVVGGFWLAHDGKTIPDALIAIGSTALGGAGSFLVSTRGSADPLPPPIEVAAPKAD